MVTGNFGGRAAADAFCAASANRPVGASLQYRALLSTSADDEVRDMPAK